ncbi:MAG: nitroreductase family protein [Devosia sp.]|nr:nitroreductase family protein [Devosia sp.]
MNRRRIMFGTGGLVVAGTAAAGFGAYRSTGMDDYDRAASELRARLAAHPQLRDFVRLATLAPNGHNTQPWLFGLGADHIAIGPDFTRRTPVVDPDDHHLFVSLGCAAENLSLALAAAGQGGQVRFDATGDGALAVGLSPGPAVASPLADAITLRQSTRVDYDGRPVPAADLATLTAAAAIPGVELLLLTDGARIEPVLELILAGNSAQMADPAFVRELRSWIRFSPARALATRDGLFSPTNGNPAIPEWLGGLLFGFVYTPASENDKYAHQVRSSAGLAIFVSEASDKQHWVNAGRAAQRFALQATALGLKHAFVNQAVEVPAVRAQLTSLLGVGDRRPDLVMRFGYGPETPRSLRRPVDQLLVAA